MRLGVFDTVGNLGGGSRFLESLLPALKECRPGIEIVYYGNPASVRREGHFVPFAEKGIVVKSLPSQRLASEGILGLRGTARLVRSVQKRWADVALLPASVAGAVHREIERVGNECDVAYFPWPYLLECPRLRVPMVGTFHDFNFRYFFGLPVFSDRQSGKLHRTLPDWLARVIPVVSTKFMASEAAALYPECRERIQVIYLAPLLPDTGIGREEAERIVRGMGVCTPYAIYPTHLTVHKNIGPLLAAVSILEAEGFGMTLVLTGLGTQAATGRAGRYGVERDASPPNVLGLGYVANTQMDALIRCASAVVSSSLYEAGNGPGLDAWARGVPVAMSSIPSFLEHIEVQGVRAKVFDPRCPRDIAGKIGEILSDPARALEDAQESLRRIREVTWRRTAEQYLSVFDRAVG